MEGVDENKIEEYLQNRSLNQLQNDTFSEAHHQALDEFLICLEKGEKPFRRDPKKKIECAFRIAGHQGRQKDRHQGHPKDLRAKRTE